MIPQINKAAHRASVTDAQGQSQLEGDRQRFIHQAATCLSVSKNYAQYLPTATTTHHSCSLLNNGLLDLIRCVLSSQILHPPVQVLNRQI